MSRFLESRIKRPVEVVTAPNFKVFHERTLKGEYDVAVTGAHLVRLAQIDMGLVPVLTYRPALAALMITPTTKPLRTVQDLKGQSLAFANPQSLVALRGLEWLREQGLRAGAEFSVAQTPTQDSLGQLLLSGGAGAAILSGGEFRQIPEEQRSKLTVFTTIAELPSLTFAAHPRMSAAEIAALKTHLLGFLDTPEGRQFLATTGFQGLRELGAGELKTALDPYLDDVRKMMK
jgi:phosphonate transport system substrate-binding protein